MTVYYLCPDMRRPSGGLRTMYRHVDVLNELGIAASILHTRPGHRAQWFVNETPIAYPPVQLGPTDLIVVTEQFSAEKLNALAPGVPKVVGNQNAYRSFNSAKVTSTGVVSPYTSSPDVLGAFVVSEDNRDYLTYAFPGLHVAHIHQHVDATVFHPDLAARRKQIAVMPRKRPAEYQQAFGMLTNRRALVGWSVVELAGMTETEIAAALRQSVLFISLSRAEGFGLPPAEAMASGCHVIGFHGMAGREFFREPFATTIEDGDVVALARAVEAFVSSYDERAGELERIAGQASAYALSRYSKEQEKADLGAFFEAMLAKLPVHPASDLQVTATTRQLQLEAHWRKQVRNRALRLQRRLSGAGAKPKAH